VSLRHKLADAGFESNDDYEYALRCLFDAQLDHLRVLHVDGNGGRRKTAFATALAAALEYPHVLYHDFSRPEPTPVAQTVVLEDGSLGSVEPGLSGFERVVTEACAFSEAARTILIIDQLQAADFAEQLRLHRFADSGEWTAGNATVTANPRHLLLVLISEQPLYHSLARLSYRVWTDAQRAFLGFRPEHFGLGRDAQTLFDALADVFVAVEAAPTPGEFSRLLADVLQRVHGEEQLRQTIYGWTEHCERARLYSPAVTPLLHSAVDALNGYLGIDHVEM
jgi:hypothetical protein